MKKIHLFFLALFVGLFFIISFQNLIRNDVVEQSSLNKEAPLISEQEQANLNAVNVQIDKITNGDFSNLIVSDGMNLESVINDLKNIKTVEDVEWVEIDLNKDGMKELICQEKNSMYDSGKKKRIVGVFTYQDGKMRTIIWDVVDIPRYYFLGADGMIVYHDFSYGSYQVDQYSCYEFQNDWSTRLICGLEIYNIYDLDDLPNDWDKQYPDMKNIGVYYTKFTEQNNILTSETIDKEQFLAVFEEMTAFSFFDASPDWYPM